MIGKKKRVGVKTKKTKKKLTSEEFAKNE